MNNEKDSIFSCYMSATEMSLMGEIIKLIVTVQPLVEMQLIENSIICSGFWVEPAPLLLMKLGYYGK